MPKRRTSGARKSPMTFSAIRTCNDRVTVGVGIGDVTASKSPIVGGDERRVVDLQYEVHAHLQRRHGQDAGRPAQEPTNSLAGRVVIAELERRGMAHLAGERRHQAAMVTFGHVEERRGAGARR